jgi:formylglycine-generating enzyme required for sulfatase activity
MLRRHRLLFNCFAALLATNVALRTSSVFGANITIDTVQIGNPGNGNDPRNGNLYGAVPYNYAIGKYEVTFGQYEAFLNAVAATDTYGLYDSLMTTNPVVANISRSGAAGSYHYSLISSSNHPVTYVNWGDAARFCNWLNNGQPIGAEGPATTETGAYTLNGATSVAALGAVLRNPGAKWFIPTESEWYKAAYYDSAAGRYWNYATGTNTTPTSAPPGNTPNTANYLSDSTGLAVTGSKTFSTGQNYLTDVGAYTASASPYGTFDQSGNVIEWNETIITSFGGAKYRGKRGGSWSNGSDDLAASSRFADDPTMDGGGFRVATTTPEPSTGVLAVLACGAMWRSRKRFNA